MGQIRDEILLNKIAHRIKELRAEKGVTQEDILMDRGIHMARIENGKRNISISTLSAICEKLNVSLSEFFKGIA